MYTYEGLIMSFPFEFSVRYLRVGGGDFIGRSSSLPCKYLFTLFKWAGQSFINYYIGKCCNMTILLEKRASFHCFVAHYFNHKL